MSHLSIENPVIYVPIRHPSTTVEIALQIHSILTNKPNFPRFSPENDDLTKNKPNSNPIQSQFDERPKLMQSIYIQRIMKKNADMGQKKQTQFKPNFKSFRVKMDQTNEHS